MTKTTGKALLIAALGINTAGLLVGATAMMTDSAAVADIYAEGELTLPFVLVTLSTVLLILGATIGIAWFVRLAQPWLRPSQHSGYDQPFGGAAGSILLLVIMVGSIVMNGMVMSETMDEQGIADWGNGMAGSAPIETLIMDLHQRDASTRIFAAHQLGELGPSAAAAIPALRETLQDAHPPVRLYAAEALWQITGETAEVVPVLILTLEHEGADMAHTHSLAVEVLARMGPAAKDAIPVLEHTVLEHPDLDVRSDAHFALQRIRGGETLNAIE